ncbi:MAG: FG-GAP repeat domain-containing protein, partial [Candidatus Binatia bacterium]
MILRLPTNALRQIFLLSFAAGILVAPLPSGGLQQVHSQSETIGRVPHAIAVGDFNADSIPDVAVPAAAERKVAILLSNGKGGFTSNHTYTTGTGPSWVETGDFNSDGKLDLVTANTGGGDLSLYFGDGKGDFSKARDIANISGPASAVALDTNRDGRLDLAVTQPKASRLVILENLGGSFKPSATYEVGRAPHIVTKVELNRDGIPDLVVGTFARHRLSVLLGKGDGTFRAAGETQVGRFPHYVAAGDWNGDGHQDLAVACAGENAVVLLEGDGTGMVRKVGMLP